jgi:hypothetical protein
VLQSYAGLGIIPWAYIKEEFGIAHEIMKSNDLHHQG